MESARWSPPIPLGAAALSAWRELDRRTRRELLRAAGPHPDPLVACVAVGYAQTMLQGRRQFVLRRIVPTAVAVVVAMVLAVIVGQAGAPAVVVQVVPIVVMMPAMIWMVVSRTRLRLRLIRMENVNAPALLAGQTVTPSPHVPPAGKGTPLTVSFDRRVVLRQYAKGLLPFTVLLALAPVFVHWLLWLAVAYIPIMWGVLGYHLLRWVLPRRAVLVVDEAGLRFSTVPAVPWSQITEVRIHPLRSANKAGSRVIAFVCADPQAIIARMRGLRRWNTGKAMEYYGSPLVLVGRSLDHTVEEIAAAVTSFHPVPVRRFGG